MIVTKLRLPIKKGDLLLIEGCFKKQDDKPTVRLLKVKEVKLKNNDPWEIILSGSGNIYFNWIMYLEKRSWVKDVKIVIPTN